MMKKLNQSLNLVSRKQRMSFLSFGVLLLILVTIEFVFAFQNPYKLYSNELLLQKVDSINAVQASKKIRKDSIIIYKKRDTVVQRNIEKKEKQYSSQTKIRTPQKEEKILVDINFADSIELRRIKGIGKVFSRRIVKYRELLGGFTNIAQLKEVYGMDFEKFSSIKKQIQLTTTTINKINLNTDNFKTILRHPYISYDLTKNIFSERDKKPFIDESDFQARVNICDSLLDRVLPYIEISFNKLE